MKWYVMFSILLISSSSDCTILMKVSRVTTHYRYNLEANENAGADPTRKKLSLYSKQMLCDALIRVKQFMPYYPPWYYSSRSGMPTVSFTPILSSNLDSINYQRLAPVPEVILPDTWCSVNISRRNPVHMRCFQCIDTREVKWFVTLGFDHFIYLLEPTRSNFSSYYRITGLFEPSAIFDNQQQNQDYSYLEDQLRKPRILALMESVCHYGLDDRLRLCGAVLDALNTEKDLNLKSDIRHMNYLFVRNPPYDSKRLVVGRVLSTVQALPCETVIREISSTLLYLLLDIREPGTVFVFFEEPDDPEYLVYHSKVRKIAALLNPIALKEEKIFLEKSRANESLQQTAKNVDFKSKSESDSEDEAINACEEGGRSDADLEDETINAGEEDAMEKPHQGRSPSEEIHPQYESSIVVPTPAKRKRSFRERSKRINIDDLPKRNEDNLEDVLKRMNEDSEDNFDDVLKRMTEDSSIRRKRSKRN